MTAAVCLKCGKAKTGAWKRCPACGYVPKSDEERAKHLITTDHFLPRTELEAIGERIAAGLPVEFEPKQLEAVTANIRALDRQRKQRAVLKLVAAILVLIAVTIALLAYTSNR